MESVLAERSPPVVTSPSLVVRMESQSMGKSLPMVESRSKDGSRLAKMSIVVVLASSRDMVLKARSTHSRLVGRSSLVVLALWRAILRRKIACF